MWRNCGNMSCRCWPDGFGYGVFGVEFGKAPELPLVPVAPGTHGLFTPVLSVGPVPMAALLAPEAVLAPSLLVPAMVAAPFCAPAGACAMAALVLLQTGLVFGVVCANAGKAMAEARAKDSIVVLSGMFPPKPCQDCYAAR